MKCYHAVITTPFEFCGQHNNCQHSIDVDMAWCCDSMNYCWLYQICSTCSSTRTDPVGIDQFLLWAWRHPSCDSIVECLSTPWGINYKSQVDVQYVVLAMIEAQKPARLSCFHSPHALWYSELSADCNSDLPHSHNTGKPRVFSFIEVNVLLIIVTYTDLGRRSVDYFEQSCLNSFVSHWFSLEVSSHNNIY